MFGLDPLSRPVAIAEMLILLALAAFIGWLLGRLVVSGRVRSLRAAIADKEVELEACRQQKRSSTDTKPVASVTVVPAVDMTQNFVHADPLLPVITQDDTFTPIVEVPELPATGNVVVVAPVPAPPAPPASDKPVVPPVAPVESNSAKDNSESAVLSRIAARAGEINFDRIGTATAAEADDLKDIVGVGPFLERKLHSLGIYTFRQVGNFVKEDINKVNEIIEFFPGRIERDNWVGQAKEFYQRKYGNRNS